MTSTNWLDQIKWDDKGLVPVIAQEKDTGDVMMFAWICLLYTSDAADE